MLSYLYYSIFYIGFILTLYLTFISKIEYSFLAFYLAGFSYEFTSLLFPAYFQEYNILMLNMFILLYFSSLSIFFYTQLRHPILQKICVIVILVFAFAIQYELYTTDFCMSIYHSFLFCFLSATIFLLGLLFLFDLILRDEIINLVVYSRFYIGIALMFWSIMFLFRTGLMYYLAEVDSHFLSYVSTGFHLVNIITYSVICYGLLLIIFQDKNSSL